MTTATMDFEKVLLGKYPAKQHARRVAEYLRIHSQAPVDKAVLYLESQQTTMKEDNDEEAPFRQRRHFYYLSGCELPDCQLTYDIRADKITLYIPHIVPDHVIWAGLPPTPAELLARLDVDDVQNASPSQVKASVTHLAASRTVFAIGGRVADEEALAKLLVNTSELKTAIDTCRVVKDDYEKALILKANAVSSAAHHAVLRRVRTARNERELEAVFVAECMAAGAREQAYHSIVAAGTAAATLHYTPNNAPLAGKRNLLLDAGCEWRCYASDITRTFPISGAFAPESRAIYDIVLRMQTECIAMLREGVQWEAVHLRAHRIAVEGLLGLGILRGGAVEDILASRTSVKFFPHGLGHYLGMDTHDTGGNPDYEEADPMFRYLRVRGTLPAGSVITVEPGIYFCRFIVEPALEDPVHAKYIDAAVLEKYWDVGGVRIEDNVMITKTGCENLTTAVKDVEEMEKIIAASNS